MMHKIAAATAMNNCAVADMPHWKQKAHVATTTRLRPMIINVVAK